MIKELVLTMVVRKERMGYAAWCPELDIASQGHTFDEARKNLKEAVEVYVETVLGDGNINELLEKLGLTKDDIKGKHIVHAESFSGSFEIPIPV